MHSPISIKEYFLNPLVMKLNDNEIELRDSVMKYIIKSHVPYIPQNNEEHDLLKSMSLKNTAVMNEAGHITGIYPVSAFKTNKKVVFEDGSYSYAMCAIDAIGYHYAFDKPVTIESKCEYSDEIIILNIEDGVIKVVEGADEIYILHADLQNSEEWSSSCCNIMHFFSCEKHLNQWVKENNINAKVFSLKLNTANKLSWLLFSQ